MIRYCLVCNRVIPRKEYEAAGRYNRKQTCCAICGQVLRYKNQCKPMEELPKSALDKFLVEQWDEESTLPETRMPQTKATDYY